MKFLIILSLTLITISHTYADCINFTNLPSEESLEILESFARENSEFEVKSTYNATGTIAASLCQDDSTEAPIKLCVCITFCPNTPECAYKKKKKVRDPCGPDYVSNCQDGWCSCEPK